MISEEQLREELKKLDDTRYYGYNWCHQYGWLIREYIKLNKEADYLAGCIEWCPDDVPMGACYDVCSDGDEFVPKEKCVQCWRERARKEGSGNAE